MKNSPLIPFLLLALVLASTLDAVLPVGTQRTPIYTDMGGTNISTPLIFTNQMLLTVAPTTGNHLVRYTDLIGATNGFVSLNIIGSTSISNAVSGINNTLSLRDTTVVAGTYGTSTAYPSFAVNSEGRLTAVSNITVAASGGGGDVFTASNNVFTANNVMSLTGTLTMGTNVVLTSYTNYPLVVVAPKADGRNLLLFPKAGSTGVANLMLGADVSTAWSSGGGYLGTNAVFAYDNGNTYIDSPNGGFVQIQRGNTASMRISSTVFTISPGASLVLGAGNGPVHIGPASSSQWTCYFPANTNSGNATTNFTQMTTAYGGANSPVLGQLVTNGNSRATVSLSFDLVNTNSAAAIAMIQGTVTNFICIVQNQGVALTNKQSVTFNVSPLQRWFTTNLNTATPGTVQVDTNSFVRWAW